MEKVILNAEIRAEKGKSAVKKLRDINIIPAVVYRGGKEAVNIKVGSRDLFKILHTAAGANALITLKVKGDKKKTDRTCLIKEIQRNPVKENIVHVDFNEISLTDKIKAKVPVHPHGIAEGVSKEEGVLETVIWEVEVECLPTEIPRKIDAEVSQMKIGDSIFIKDLVLPSGVKVLNDPELTVFTVKPPAKEEVVEEIPGEGADEPEVISKGKKEEEEIAEAGEETKKVPPKEEKKG